MSGSKFWDYLSVILALTVSVVLFTAVQTHFDPQPPEATATAVPTIVPTEEVADCPTNAIAAADLFGGSRQTWQQIPLGWSTGILVQDFEAAVPPGFTGALVGDGSFLRVSRISSTSNWHINAKPGEQIDIGCP